jgi:hypothetical protein
MSAADELEVPPVPGLPGPLPAGERIVWQGRPAWRPLWRRAFKGRWVAGYFAALLAARCVSAAQGRQGAAGVGLLALAAGACLGLLALAAWLNARAAVYTITTRRVVLHVGVALPTTWNLPFKRLASADVAVRPAGDGDVVLRLTAPDRIGWLHLWPHAQPGHYVRARPALRALAEPDRVARLLAEAVRAWAEAEGSPARVADAFAAPAPTPAPVAAPPPAEAPAPASAPGACAGLAAGVSS